VVLAMLAEALAAEAPLTTRATVNEEQRSPAVSVPLELTSLAVTLASSAAGYRAYARLNSG
jgi:hypothetical protein